MTDPGGSSPFHDLTLSVVRLEGKVDTVLSRLATHHDTEIDHEARLRTLESQPRPITWREFLATSVLMISGMSGLLVLIDRVIAP